MAQLAQITSLASNSQGKLPAVPVARGWRSQYVNAKHTIQPQQGSNRVIAQAVPPSSRGVPARAVGTEAPAAAVAPTATRCDAFLSAKSLIEALNRRDVSAVLSLMSEDVVYDNLSTSTSLRGRAAVGRFYVEALAAIPENAVFVLEAEEQDSSTARRGNGSSNGSGPGAVPVLQAGLAWHMELNGVTVPLSRGMGVYWADPRTGLLTRVWENPEPAFKAAQPLLTSAAWASASPLLGGLTRGVSSLLNTLGNSSSTGDSTGGSSTGTSSGGFGSGVPPGIPALPNVASVLGSMLPFGSPVASSASTSSPPATSTSSSQPSAAPSKANQQQQSGKSTFIDHTGRVTTTPLVAAAPQGARPAGAVSNGAWAAAAAAAAAKQASSSSSAPGAGAASSAAAAAAAAPTAPSAAAAAAAAAPAATPSAGPFGAVSSKGDLIPMRPLSEPERESAGASTSTTSSGGATGGATAAEPAAKPAAATKAGPAPSKAAPILLPAAGSAAAAAAAPGGASESSDSLFALGGGGGSNMGSFASMDYDGDAPAGSSVDSGAAGTVHSASGGDAGDARGGWKLPFDRSYSMTADLTSLWEKDNAASQVEEYEAMLDVLELGGLQKVTARLIDGLDLKQGEDKFEVSFVTVVPFFRVTEKSRFTTSTSMMRRDLRGGRQTSIASRVPGGVEVKMTWENPLAGSLTEEYLVSEDGSQLAVTSAMRIGQREAKATQIYRRSSRNRNEFLNQQRSSYGSMEDVLRKQEQKYGKIKY